MGLKFKPGDRVLVPNFDPDHPGHRAVIFDSWKEPGFSLWVRDEDGFQELYLLSEIKAQVQELRKIRHGYRRRWAVLDSGRECKIGCDH
jgi:hypothetical protein